MSLWDLVSKVPPEKLQRLYVDFPQHMRHLLGEWLENQPWEFLVGSDSFSYNMASALLSATVQHLQTSAGEQGEGSALLQHINTLENIYQREPLKLVATCKQILQGEKKAVMEEFHHLPMSFRWKQEELKFSTIRQRLQHRLGESRILREELQQEARSDPVPLPQLRSANGTGPREKLATLLQDTVEELELAQVLVLKRLHLWKRQQQLAGNGAPFDESLGPLQERYESLVDIYSQLQQELGSAGGELEPKTRALLLSRLDEVLRTLVTSSFLVEKQPPQVLKTQTKFQAGVRFLLGLRFLGTSAKLPMVRADMVTEKQARELNQLQGSGTGAESTGEIINNTVPLENSIPGNCCSALFKNLLLKKIKRCERKGTESVTEEKCAVLFSTSFTLGPNKLPIQLQALSLPLVVIVHGNQDNNAKATILWDNAFSEMDRMPFVVSERVPWEKMCETLNLKFTAEVGTSQGLLPDHFLFLAQKIFNDNSLSIEAFQHRFVSWSQFNKEILLGRGFTFWQWFDGVLDLTKRCLRSYWSDRLIIGFISKQYVTNLLLNQPDGTFLLRFSDSEIGGITIAHVIRGQDGSSQIENIQPFSAKDLSIRSLGDRIRDLVQLKNLYPNKPKDEAFRSHYKPEQMGKDIRGYVPTAIKMTVESREQLLSTPETQMPPRVPSYGHVMNPNSSVNICPDMPRVYPPHPHPLSYSDRPPEEPVPVMPTFPDLIAAPHHSSYVWSSRDLLPCQPHEHVICPDVTMAEENCLSEPVGEFQNTWGGPDIFPPFLPPTEQDLNNLLEGQGESGALQHSSYGQSGIPMSHLDLRANPSW